LLVSRPRSSVREIARLRRAPLPFPGARGPASAGVRRPPVATLWRRPKRESAIWAFLLACALSRVPRETEPRAPFRRAGAWASSSRSEGSADCGCEAPICRAVAAPPQVRERDMGVPSGLRALARPAGGGAPSAPAEGSHGARDQPRFSGHAGCADRGRGCRYPGARGPASAGVRRPSVAPLWRRPKRESAIWAFLLDCALSRVPRKAEPRAT